MPTGARAVASWREPPDRPAVVRSRPDQAVVQTRFASLPELEAMRHDAHAAPVARTRHVRCESRLHGGGLPFEPIPIGDRRALRRCPGGKLRCARPRREVRVRFGGAGAFGEALDPNLAFETDPEEEQRNVWSGSEFASLAAVVVRMEHEAAGVEALQ